MAPAPTIASVTLHPRSDDMALDALRSVLPYVDACILIDTHPSPYRFHNEREVCGEKFRTVWAGPILDGSGIRRGRDACLAAAHRLGFDWALMLDTDERLVPQPGADLRGQLAATTDDVLLMWSALGVYPKDKLFRLPPKGRWVEDMHETFHGFDSRGTVEGFTFSELPRDPATAKRRLETIRDSLERQLRDPWPSRARAWLLRSLAWWTEGLARLTNLDALRRLAGRLGKPSLPSEAPEVARRWYYLGDALEGLGDAREAMRCFLRAGNTSLWDEEAAWSFFRAGLILAKRGQWDDAFSMGLMSIGRHAGFGDVLAFCASVSGDSGRHDQAIIWARLALVYSAATGGADQVPRVHFNAPNLLWEGPYQVMADAYRMKGDDEMAKSYDEQAKAAEAMRLAREAAGVRR